MEWIITHAADLLAIVTSIVTVASLIANLTPTETDNKIVAVVSKFINALALNFKK